MADQIAERPGTGGGAGKGTVRYHDETDGSYSMAEAAHLRYWNTSTLQWERATGSGGVISVSGAGGGGGAATIADGADVAEGTTTDPSSASTVIGLLKAIKAAVQGTLTTTTSWAAAQHVIVDSAPTTAVTGPLTDTQLRASAVPVSLAVAPTTAVTGPLTDTQLRASAVPVSMATQTPDVTDRSARLLGHVTVDNASVAVTMASQTPDVTDRSARLLGHVTVDSAPTTAVTLAVAPTTPITAASLPLPTGAATDATLLAALGSSSSTDVPSAWTVLDQLNRIRKLETQNGALLAQLVALQTPKVAPKVQPTLLHRS